MQKLLPKTTKNPQGFTLIELLVVVAIISILSVIGITLYATTQQRARDSKRIQDVISMSKAMEVNYVSGSGYTTPLSATWFADGIVPTNPSPGGGTYYTNSPTTAGYTFCAALENSVAGNATTSDGGGIGAIGTGQYFCRKNSQ